MHVLTTSNSTQVLKVIPRRQNNGVVTMSLIDKSTNRQSNYVSEYYWHTTDFYFNELDVNWNQDPDFVFAYADVFSTVTSVFYLKEGTFYTIKLSDVDGELYEGMIFCTDQTDYDKYDPNKNDYIMESTYDNEYVIL